MSFIADSLILHVSSSIAHSALVISHPSKLVDSFILATTLLGFHETITCSAAMSTCEKRTHIARALDISTQLHAASDISLSLRITGSSFPAKHEALAYASFILNPTCEHRNCDLRCRVAGLSSRPVLGGSACALTAMQPSIHVRTAKLTSSPLRTSFKVGDYLAIGIQVLNK